MNGQNNIRKIKWTNKFSGEQGFVRSISKTNKCFYNTYDYNEAKCYRNDASIRNDMLFLDSIGETKNNIFCVV